MFKEELIKFLLSTENFKELDEWYISDFDDKHVHGISYEQGYPMLTDCCEVWMQYPQNTFELINIMSSIRNMMSTNTFPEIFIENKENILTIYCDTENRVRTLINRVYEGEGIEPQLIQRFIASGIEDEKLMFSELFYRSNIDWFKVNRELHSCKICGYYDEEFLPWGLDGEFPLYEICPCCGAESGYEDFTLESIIHNRDKWTKSPKFNSDEKYKKQLVNYIEYLK